MITKAASLLLVGAAAIAFSTPTLAATASSSAYDASLSLNVGTLSVNLPAVNPVGGSAPPTYNLNNSVLSYNNTQTLSALGLPLDTLTVTAETLNSAASGSTTTATASATIQNLVASLSTFGGTVPLAQLSATTIQSMSTAGGGAPTGSSTIQGVTLSGSLIGAPITFTIPSTLPANDVVFSLGGLELVLNEQTPLTGGISTNAVDLILNGFTYGGTTPVYGNLILSHSQAQVLGGGGGTVPEPAAWVEMLLGFSVLGGLARRRNSFAKA